MLCRMRASKSQAYGMLGDRTMCWPLRALLTHFSLPHSLSGADNLGFYALRNLHVCGQMQKPLKLGL